MSNIYDVFGVTSDLQLSNIFNKLDITPYEMLDMDTIINSNISIKKKREQILEMMSSSADGNYELCENVFEKARLKMRRFVKENYNNSSQPLNMNQILELNKLFTLAAEKFQKVNCSQQFYDLLTQKTSKNVANAFFNTLKNISENAECKFDPELIIDGQNFAETIFPFVNELINFLNGCKEEKKEEVKENYNADKLSKIDHQIARLENNLKKFEQEKNSYLDEYSKLEYKLDKVRLRKLKAKREEYLNESDSKKLDESLEDTLNNFKYFITSSNNEKELNYIKDKLEILFNQANDTEIRNNVSELLSMINSKLNKEKSSINECCELDNLLEPFKATVVNITVNNDGCLEDCEKEIATNNLKALASHINDKKDCCEENNIENMQTINSLLSSLASFFQKRLCESQSYEKYDDVREELNYIKQRYLDGELDVYDATNEVDGLIGDKSNAEAIVDSWDDSSKHGLYGINNEALLNRISSDPNVYIQGRDEIDDSQEPDIEKILDSIKYIANTYNKTFSEAKEIYSEISNTDVYSMEELDEDTVYDHSWYEVEGQKYPKRTKEGVICESENDVLNDILSDLDKYLDDNNSINTETVCDVIEKNMRKNNIPDESFDDLFAEVNGKLVSYDIRMIDESIKDWFKKDNRKYRIEYGTNGGWISKDKKYIVGDLTDTLIVTGLKKAERLAKYFDNGEEPRMFHPDEIKQTDKGWNFKYTQEFLDILEKVKNGEMSEEEAKNYFEKIGLPLDQYWIYLKLALPNKKKVNEMCSGGACCSGAVATIPSPAKPKTPKRKHKKSKVDEMALNMFKRQIIEDANGQINLNGNHYEYKNGYLYINGDIARTKSKHKMLEYLDENIELETLSGFNSEEMKLLEDIEASENVGNEDDNNQNNNSNNNNNADNNNNQQNINQNNLGNVDQNVTQDNDLTPQQRQLKKDTEKTLDQSMKSGSDTEVSVNQGLDNNNDTINNPTPNTNNIKYKVIGKDDSDTNNIKYIIQDPNTKQTMVVDATKLRLEK